VLRGVLTAFALVFVWLAVAGPAVVQAQNLSAVAVAERQRDFGRLTLQFRDRLELPPYEVDVENGVMRIVFEEPVDTDIRDAVRTLSDFVTITRRDPDGLALRLGLARAVRINTMEAGETLFIDFLPTSWQGFPPPLPEEVVERLAQRAEQAAREAAEAERRRLLGELEPEVALRVGHAPTFTRYAFNWNVPFNVSITQSGSELSMQFDYDVPIDLSPARIDQAAELEEIDAARDGASLTVTMNVVPGSRMRWFEDLQSFIVDIDRDEPLNEDDLDSQAIAEALDAIHPSLQDETPASGQFESVGGRTADVVVPEAETELAAESQPLDGQTIVLQTPQSSPRPTDSEMAEVAVPGFSEPTHFDPTVTPPVNAMPGVVEVGEERRAPEVADPQQDEEPQDMIRIEVRSDGNIRRLIFPFENETPAAMFRRGSTITLVFETEVSFDLRSLGSELRDIVRRVSPIRFGALQVVRFEMADNALVSVAPSGERWIVALGSGVLEPPNPVEIGRGTFADGKAYAEIVDPGLGHVYRLRDPHVGDDLLVAPLPPPSRGALASQDMVEFELLNSAHGIVVRPKVDDFSAQVDAGRLLMTRDQGLVLSELGLSLGSFGFSPDERPGYFDLRAYHGDGARGFEERFSNYHDEISAAEGPVRIERLMDFSRFLLAFGLGQEANGALDMALGESSALEHDPAYLAVRAAALTMAGRYEEAKVIVDSHAMTGIVDASFWRLLSDAALRNWPEVNESYDEVSALFDSYPSNLVTQARLGGVEAALELQAIDLAADRLAQIDPSLARDRMRVQLHLLDARLALATGRTDEALAGLDAVVREDEGPAAAYANLLSIQTRIETGEMDRNEGLEALENLAVAWRGDNTEVQTRTLMGDLYVADERYKDALFALKGVVIAQPDHPMANDVSDQMQEVFTDLFLNGEADRLPAIDALSLFYDFRELTPVGRRGDEMVRRLADRLVEIDLLDQAADLLEHQVEHRLTGAAKAQIAADLALIYLMDYRPGEAVATLQRSRLSHVPMSIERVRRIIEARALSELGRHELALEMLRNVDGSDAAAVRADVLWNAERWQEAGEVIEQTLGQRWNDSVPLDDDEMHQVLRSAIAFSFANDQYALNRLRARFDEKMSDGVFASAFDVVTAPIETHGSAFRDVARSIAGLNTLNRFLTDYRTTFASQAIGS
jgi:tetratricopeptide (TPR) repeat protein